MFQVDVQKNLIGLEDLLLGEGQVNQTRGSTVVPVTKINIGSLPYDGLLTLDEKIQEVNAQFETLEEKGELLQTAVQVVALLQALQVNIDELAAWLANGSNTLSAFQPYAQRVTQNEVLADGVNYTMLAQTVIEEDVTITLGVDTHLYILQAEEYIPE